MASAHSLLTAILAAMIPAESLAQSETIVTGTEICADVPPPVTLGPVRSFDGIMFSFLDGVIFTPCRRGRRCDASSQGDTFDVETVGTQPRLERAWTGWGYYRLRFRGRLATRDLSGTCTFAPSQYYVVERVLSARRVADPPAR